MKSRKDKSKYFLLQYIGVPFLICAGFLLINVTGINRNVRVIQSIMMIGILLVIGLTIYKCYITQFRWDYVILSILFIGIIMRFGYMIYTPITIRSHDLGDIFQQPYGHADYIYYIYQTGHLPDVNIGQLYHPPLFHLLSAVSMKICGLFWHPGNDLLLMESAKIVSCLASIGTLYVGYKITKEVIVSEKAQTAAIAMIAFLPNMYLLAGRVNNDSLSIFFMTSILLWTIRWYQQQTLFNTFVLALCFGFGMMSKASCVILAFVTGPVMLIVLFQAIRKKRMKPVIQSLTIFAVIAVPIGMWFPIRNLLRFGQSFTYILPIRVDSPLYIGDISVWRRFIEIPLGNIFDPIYNQVYDDYHLFSYWIKGALFGEFEFDINKIWPTLLLAVHLLLVSFSLYAGIHHVVHGIQKACKKQTLTMNQRMLSFVLPMAWVIIVVFNIYFNLRYPFGCTMDFRYVVPIAVIGAVELGGLLEEISKKLLYLVSFVLITCFSFLSIIMFCNISI